MKKYYSVYKHTRKEERKEVVLRRGVDFTVTIQRSLFEKIKGAFVDPAQITAYKLGSSSSRNKVKGTCTHPDTSNLDKITCTGIPFTARVGRQKIFFKAGGSYKEDGTVFVIFNPYHEDSPVYMEEDDRKVC